MAKISNLKTTILKTLDANKALDIVTIELAGKSSIADFYFQILNLNNKKVASIGTLGINTYLKKTDVKNTTLDPISLNYHLQKIKKLKINNIILEASSHVLKQNRLDGLKFNLGIFSNLSHVHLDYHRS